MQLEKNKKISAKNFIFLLGLLILLGIVGAIYQGKNTLDLSGSDNIKVQKKFEDKIVYTMNTSLPLDKYKEDCEKRGGEFNDCGTICAPDADICGEVCAYTCDLSGTDTDKDKTQVPEDWKEYTNQQYGFSIKHPPEWKVQVDETEIITVIHLLPKENKIEDAFKRTGITHVSIYPEGLPTEGIFSQSASTEISMNENIDMSESRDLLLKNGDRWASVIEFKKSPASWEEYGFIWAGVKINNQNTDCLDRNGNELSRKECDPMTKPHQIVWSGSVDDNIREIEKKMLKSFEFTEQLQNDTQQQNTDNKKGAIKMTRPVSGAKVDSPLIIEGQARGPWYFEGSFSAVLKNANSETIGETAVEAQDDWMTEEMVPFRAEMEFEKPGTEQGVLFLKKANPSGLSENAEKRAIPVKFQ